MNRILLPVLFLAAAGIAANGCDRDDSAVGPKSEPAGIGRDVAKAPSTGPSETTSKAAEDRGSGVAQSGKDTSVGSTSGERTGSGADTSVSKGSPSAGASETSKAGEGLGSGVAQTGKDSAVGGTTPSEGTSSAGPTDPTKAETSPGSTAQSEKDSSVAGSGTDTPRSAESGDPSKAGQDASRASQSQDMGGQQDVRQAQQALKNQGQDPGPIDGILGPQTRQALRGFQKANGLEQTGTLDAETKQKLNIDGASSGSSASGSGQKEPSSSPMSK